MKIKFSRHAKRRAKLYGVSESDIMEALAGQDLVKGKIEITRTIEGFDLPIKIIANVENDIIIVITNYPLKKGRQG